MSHQIQIRDGMRRLATEIEAVKSTAGGGSVYSATGSTYQLTSTHTHRAWQRVDGAGYLAQRRELATGNEAGEATGALPIPADLSTLTYS